MIRRLDVPRLFALAITVVLALVALTPTAAVGAEGDGSSFSSPYALPLAELDGTPFQVTTASRFELGSGSTTMPPPFWHNTTWYEFTAPVSGVLEVNALSASTFDNALELWTASGALVALDDDSGASTNAEIVVAVTAGTTYRVAIGAWSSAHRGDATLALRLSPPPGAPTNVTVVPGDREAAVTWTAPAGPTAPTLYTLHCSPSGEPVRECGTAPAGQTSATTSALVNGAPTTITVTSTYRGFNGSTSTGVQVTPRGTTTIAMASDPAAPVSGEAFAIVATVTTSDGAPATGDVTFDIPDSPGPVALVDGEARVTVAAPVGALPVTAIYAGSPAHAGSTVTGSLTVGQAGQSVTLDPFGPLSYGDPDVTVSGSATSGGSVTFAASGACAVSGSTLQVLGAGDCTVTAAQAGTAQHLPADTSVTVTIGQLVQSLTLAVPELDYGESGDVVASSSAGLPVALAATGACTILDGRVSATDVGTCAVTATQDGTVDVAAAAPVTVHVTVERRTQSVTIAPLGTLTFSGSPVAVEASSSVDLPVTLTAVGACVMADGGLLTVAAGECTVTAVQAGDEHTLPAQAALTVDVVGTAIALTIDLDAELGDLAAGTPVTVQVAGALPGADLVLSVPSTPQELARVTVAADGTATVSGTLPAGLEAGDHRLVAAVTDLAGVAASAALSFAVDADGAIVRIEDSELAQEEAPEEEAPEEEAPEDEAPEDEPAEDELPRTGAAGLTGLAALAGTLLLAGVGLLALRRRRSLLG